MTLELIAFRPPPGAWKAFDTVATINEDKAREFFDEDYRAVFRYSRRDGNVLDNPIPGGEYGDAVANGCHSLSISESRGYFRAGLAVGLVQFGSFGSVSWANELGRNAAAASRRLGFPGGHHHFADLEGESKKVAGYAACRDWSEAWAAACIAGGQSAPRAGLYRCGHVPFSARQAYAIKGITCYWAAAGPVPYPPYPRGDSIRQRVPSDVCGIQVDRNIIRTDCFGDGPVLVGTPEIKAAWYAEALAKLTESMLG